METIAIETLPRSELGTGRARRLRNQGLIPAVFYRGRSSKPIAIPEKALRTLLARGKKGITLLRLLGGEFPKEQFALLKEVQWHPYKNQVIHVDLQGVDLEEEISVYIPLHFEGQPRGVKQGGVLEILAHELRLRLKVKNIPAFIPVDLTPLQVGAVLHVREIELPEGVRFLGDPDTPIAHVVVPTKEEETTEIAEAKEEVTASQVEGEKAKEGEQKESAPKQAEKKGKK